MTVCFEQIWLTRNKVRIGDSCGDWDSIWKTINSSVLKHWRLLPRSRKTRILSDMKWKWIPPPQNILKMNFDAAFVGDYATVAWVLRDHQGTMLRTWTSRFFASSALEADAKACYQALQQANLEGCKHLILESDSLCAINVLNGVSPADAWCFKSIFYACRHILCQSEQWIVCFVGRDANDCSHVLAKWAASTNSFGCMYIDVCFGY